jgi:hypothetical protein
MREWADFLGRIYGGRGQSAAASAAMGIKAKVESPYIGAKALDPS